jgi:hypothetical protein
MAIELFVETGQIAHQRDLFAEGKWTYRSQGGAQASLRNLSEWNLERILEHTHSTRYFPTKFQLQSVHQSVHDEI